MSIVFIICILGIITCFILLWYDCKQDEKFYNTLDIGKKECYNDNNKSIDKVSPNQR